MSAAMRLPAVRSIAAGSPRWGRVGRGASGIRAQIAACARLHCRGLAVVGLLATVAGLGLSFYLWAGQRFAPPPVSFIGGVAPLAVHFPMALAYSVIGSILAARQPRNPLGWLFLAVGLMNSYVPAVHNLVAAAGNSFVAPGPVTLFLAWLVSCFDLPLTGALLTLVFLVFPDGRALPGRWRIGGILAVGGALAVGFGMGVDPTGLVWYPTLPNPFGAPAWLAPAGKVVQLAGLVAVLAGLGIATVAMVVRYRRYTPEQRKPLRWIGVAMGTLIVSGGALLIVRYGMPVDPSTGALVLTTTVIAATLLPIAAGIGMLRHRLFDVDLILNHALVYIPLSALMTGIYTASVVLFQRIFVAVTGDTSDVAIIISTLILASAFTPMRKALEGVVDRHFKPAPGHEHGRRPKDPAPSVSSAVASPPEAVAVEEPVAALPAAVATDAEATMRALLEQLQSVESRLASLEASRRRKPKAAATPAE